MDAFTVDDTGDFSVTYTITGPSNQTVAPFTIGIYGSPGGSSFQPTELLQTYPVTDPSLLAAGTYTVTFAGDPGQLDSNCFLVADLDVYNNVRETTKADKVSAPLSGVFQTGDDTVYAFTAAGAPNSRQIMKYWGVGSGGIPQVTDCLGAARIIMARGLMDVIKPQTFDALYESGTVPMKPHDVPISQMRLGDWGYLENDTRYEDRPIDYGYRGEDIIMVGDDSYFGFPRGALSLAAWTKVLIDAFNVNLQPPQRPITDIPGWQPSLNKFLDVATIAMNVFDYRNKKPGT
jgi:hypothetical protein